MPYSLNPYLPKLRAKAVNQVRSGQTIRQVARYFGVNPSTVSRWCKKAPVGVCQLIATAAARPKTSPRQLAAAVRLQIIRFSRSHKSSLSQLHRHLLKQGIKVSLSSVRRIITLLPSATRTIRQRRTGHTNNALRSWRR